MLVRGFIAAVILATHATAAMSAVWSGCAVNALIGLPLGFWTYGTGYSQASCNVSTTTVQPQVLTFRQNATPKATLSHILNVTLLELQECAPAPLCPLVSPRMLPKPRILHH